MDDRVIPDPADALRHHGGNINAARVLFPEAPEPWIDLSTGINPRAYPIGRISPSAWRRLPDAGATQALEAAARSAYGVPETAEVVAAPGTQALIQWLPKIASARRVAILGETYSGHATAWESTGCEVVLATQLSELADCNVGVVVNPNNPDGRLLRPAPLLELSARMATQGALLVVDEAFMDVIGREMSVAAFMPPSSVVVLRSFGKAFGLPGLRLGFAVAAPPLADAIRTALGPWAISGPAIDVALRALRDRSWLDRETLRLKRYAMRLDGLLEAAGFSIIGGTPLFRLARHEDAHAWFELLGRGGVLTRPFAGHNDLLRFGIPSGQLAWRRLAAILSTRRKVAHSFNKSTRVLRAF
jgi:cobalamin biosynthesis protein CobC